MKLRTAVAVVRDKMTGAVVALPFFMQSDIIL